MPAFGTVESAGVAAHAETEARFAEWCVGEAADSRAEAIDIAALVAIQGEAILATVVLQA